MTEREMCNRAVSAYLRKNKTDYGQVMYPSAQMVQHNSLDYVVLSNVRGTLAVYRVRIVNGAPVLKGMKRWPAEVAGPVQ